MRALRLLAAIIFVIALPTALITTTVRYVANEPRVYTYAIDQYDAVRVTGIEREELMRAGAEIRQYFNNDQEDLLIRVDLRGREVDLFNERESVHMKDVKGRFVLMNRVQEFTSLFVLGYVAIAVLWAREVTARQLATQSAVSSVIVLLAIGAAGALGASGFESAWADFHGVIFDNDLWRLNPTTDRLIQMFPPAFWENIVFLIGLLAAAEAALLLFVSGIYLGVTKRHSQARRLYPRYA